MDVPEALAPANCPDCHGTGRNGRIGPYALICRLCAGLGHRVLTYRHA